MSQEFIVKNVKLSIEFDEYLAKHPGLYNRIPDGATIVVTIRGDEGFSLQSKSIVAKSRSKKPVVEAQKQGSTWRIQPLALRIA